MKNKFKTALFGYAKRDVCEYLASLSDEFTDRHAAEKQALADENARLKDELAAQTDAVEQLKASLAEQTARTEQAAFDAEAKRAAAMLAIEQFTAEQIAVCRAQVEAMQSRLREVMDTAEEGIAAVAAELDATALPKLPASPDTMDPSV